LDDWHAEAIQIINFAADFDILSPDSGMSGVKRGGTIITTYLKSASIGAVAAAISPEIRGVPPRAGESLEETLVAKDELSRAWTTGDRIVICASPVLPLIAMKYMLHTHNAEQLTREEIAELVK
jgi:hypothetical protein